MAANITGIIQHLSRQLNIIICKLANLGVVDAQNFGFLGRAEREAGDQVHDEEDETGSAERIRHSADGIGKLVTELHPVVVEPAAVYFGEAIEMRYVICGEEAGKHVTDEASNSMDGEDIERVVNTEYKLELGGIIGASGSDDTVDDGSPSGYETRSGGDGYETSNNTGAETDGRPFALQTVVHHAPGDTTDTGCQVGYNSCHYRA